MGRRSTLLGFMLVVALGAPDAVAAGGTRLSATLDGAPIRLARVGSLQCHDFEYPVIRCYRTGPRLRSAVQDRIAGPGDDSGGAGIAAVSYVRIYEDAAFDGASMYLSASYANLGVIGWNDRISSYRSINAGSGVFSEHADGGGTDTYFCCNTSVSYVGAAKNDTFSSVTGSA